MRTRHTHSSGPLCGIQLRCDRPFTHILPKARNAFVPQIIGMQLPQSKHQLVSLRGGRMAAHDALEDPHAQPKDGGYMV